MCSVKGGFQEVLFIYFFYTTLCFPCGESWQECCLQTGTHAWGRQGQDGGHAPRRSEGAHEGTGGKKAVQSFSKARCVGSVWLQLRIIIINCIFIIIRDEAVKMKEWDTTSCLFRSPRRLRRRERDNESGSNKKEWGRGRENIIAHRNGGKNEACLRVTFILSFHYSWHRTQGRGCRTCSCVSQVFSIIFKTSSGVILYMDTYLTSTQVFTAQKKKQLTRRQQQY